MFIDWHSSFQGSPELRNTPQNKKAISGQVSFVYPSSSADRSSVIWII
jgi:hypothetical protein